MPKSVGRSVGQRSVHAHIGALVICMYLSFSFSSLFIIRKLFKLFKLFLQHQAKNFKEIEIRKRANLSRNNGKLPGIFCIALSASQLLHRLLISRIITFYN